MTKLFFLLLTVMIAATGCTGLSDSSASSGSISSLSASSTAPASAPHAYHSDLENTVVLAMRRGNSDDDLLRQIGIVAQRHGLSDWESVEDSFAAIGAGLREAAVSAATAQSVADLVSAGDATRRQLVLNSFGG